MNVIITQVHLDQLCQVANIRQITRDDAIAFEKNSDQVDALCKELKDLFQSLMFQNQVKQLSRRWLDL